MKKTLLLNLVLIAGLVSALPMAHAATVTTSQPVSAVRVHNSFTFMIDSMTDDGNEILYNTDSVQQEVTDVLNQLGATNVSVEAYGGMGQIVFSPTVQVTFDSIQLPSASLSGTALQAVWKSVTLQGDSNGHLVEQTLEGVQDYFALQGFQPGDNNLGFQDSYNYALTVLSQQ